MGAAITINGGYQVTLKNQNSTVAVYSDNGGNTIQGGDYNYNIDLQGPSATLNLGNGQDTINAHEGNYYISLGDTVGGGQYNVTVNASNGSNYNDTIFTTGNATVSGPFGVTTYLAGNGSIAAGIDLITSINGFEESIQSGSATINATNSQTYATLIGGSGNDVFRASTWSNETLTGGDGNDTFSFLHSSSVGTHPHDEITDFIQGQDKIYVEGMSWSALSSHISTVGLNTVISLNDGTQITLDNVTTLAESDITTVKPI